MTNLSLNQYYREIESGHLASSFETLKTLYDLADNALADLAHQAPGNDDSSEVAFLERKELLVSLAAQSRCKSMQEISRKLDFLTRVHLNEKNSDAFSPTDLLLKSIWEDSRDFL